MNNQTKVRMLDYMVHFKWDGGWLYFEAYPVQDWKNIYGESGVCYMDKENKPKDRYVFEEGKCVKKFEGSFCWRGVWEGRLYFTDKEYWGEEISEMSDLYNNHIVPFCKEYIKRMQPNIFYLD